MKGKRALSLAAILSVSLGWSVPEAAAGPRKINNCKTITRPGSYVLKKDLTATGDCLLVQAEFVTIDLGGHTITGNGTGSGITDGSVKRRGIVVRNGTITNFEVGISFFLSSARVAWMRSIANAGAGIMTGLASTISDSTVQDNGGIGIVAGTGNNVTHNLVQDNGGDGITTSGGTTVAYNTIRSSIGNGISAAGDQIIRGNDVVGSTGHGIAVGGGSIVSGNTSNYNTLNGINVGCPCNVFDNTATSNTGVNLNLAGGGCTNVNNLAP